MDYLKKEIKEGITLHLIKNKGFKTDFSVLFLSVPLEKENISKNAIMPAVLRDGCRKYNEFQKINKQLDMLYGASFDCGIDKTGDNLVLKYFIESINDNFLPDRNDNLIKSLQILIEVVFNPLIENDSFNDKYVETEKRNLETIINGVKDNKDLYAFERCINIMYKNTGYGLSKYGEIEDLKSINSKNLYEYYRNLIETAKIDFIMCGDFDQDKIENAISENEFVQALNPRKEPIVINHFKKEVKEEINDPNIVREKFDVTQGKLVIGLDILPNNFEDFRFVAIIYNTIFGNSANSKLFQIVRERESLAYTARSEYITQKNNIFIRCGIECENYEKAVTLIKKLLEDMKNGDFSEEDIRKAKEYVASGIDSINEEQESQILFKFGQELSKLELSVEQYKKNVEKVTHEQIAEFAKYVQVNCIYFLENGGENAGN